MHSAMIVGGGMDDDGNDIQPSGVDFALHFLSMPWKILFACTPPTEWRSGYPAFIVSLLLIGVLTTIIEQVSVRSQGFYAL